MKNKTPDILYLTNDGRILIVDCRVSGKHDAEEVKQNKY